MRSYILSLIFTSAVLLALPACSKYSDFCEKQSDCEGGNDNDIDACVEASRGEEDVADAYDCSDEYDDLFECVDENASCKSGHFTAGDDCDGKASALSKCIKGASGKD